MQPEGQTAEEGDQTPAQRHHREALPGADVSYALPFFEDLRIAVQFWYGDEEFSPRLRFLWDAAADQYLRYETMYYALSLLRTRLQALG